MQKETRMHSSRMHTARLLPVSSSMHCSGGVPGPGGLYLVRGYLVLREVYLVPGGYLVRGHLVWGEECTWSWGMYLVPWGYLVPGGTWSRGGVPTQVLPPVNRMTDRCKILPCPKLRNHNVSDLNCYIINFRI